MENQTDIQSLNHVQNNTESTMLLMMFVFVVSGIVTILSTLYLLHTFNFLFDTPWENFKILFSHPLVWLDYQVLNFRTLHINNAFLAYATYSIVMLVPITITFYATYLIYKAARSTAGSEIITKGLHVETDTVKGQAIAEAMLTGATGYRVHENIHINKEQENAHTLIAGATRSGKSQTIAHALNDIYSSKERAVVFDLKGDLVARMYGKKGVAIINPADTRSLYWHISKDILNAASCRMLALAFLPKNLKDSQPMFADNARLILAGLLIALCKKKPRKWDWVDFANITNLTPLKQKKILGSIKHRDCQAASNIITIDMKSGEPSKTTASVYSSLAPAISTLNQIADWYGKAPATGGFSLKQFVQNQKQKTHFVIMSAQADKMDSEYGPLYAAFYTMLINFGVAPSISQNDGRRLHIVIDELGLFPKMALPKLVQFGGGFGLCLLAGIQEIAGLSKYSKEEITTILSNINTLAVGKLNDNETAGLIASLFGKQRTERQNIQANAQGISTSYSAQDRDALLDSDFLNMPKASLKNGYEMFLRTDSEMGPVRVKLHYNVIPRKPIASSFIPVSDDDEFSIKKNKSTKKRSTATSGGSSSGHQLKKQSQETNSNSVAEQSDLKQQKTTVINIDTEKAKTAAKVIAATEAINPIEDEVVELAGEAMGAPEGSTHVMGIALELADIIAESTATANAVSTSQVTSTTEEGSTKKRIRFRKKESEAEEEEAE